MVVADEEIEDETPSERDIHTWFSLSYCSYLVLPRLLLSNMPMEWQTRFLGMMDELEARFGSYPEEGSYDVRLKDDKGRFMHDPLCDYRRGTPPDPPAKVQAKGT